MPDLPDPEHPPLRTFGRIKSRPIKPRQAALLETLLPGIRPPAGDFDLRALMPGAAEAWLEIGFGGGEHMAAQAAKHPDVVILGAEPFQNGVASALRHIDDAGLKNVRVHDGDVRELLGRMPDASLARAFILFPDPWPKSRHHKRRLIQPTALDAFARLLRAGGRRSPVGRLFRGPGEGPGAEDLLQAPVHVVRDVAGEA